MRFLVAIWSALLLSTADATILEHGVGVIYGQDHAFSLQAPTGWVLDNESAVRQNVHAVFYPKGSTWEKSTVVAYARSRPRTEQISTADDVATSAVADFRANGSPKYSSKRIKTIKTEHGKEAVIYHYFGDEWGNSEAAAYFVEEKTINFVVLTARNSKVFASSLPAFEALAQSYTFLGEQLPEPFKAENLSASHFDDVRARAKTMGETDEGKHYEHELNSEVSDVLAKPFGVALRECTKETKTPYQVSIVLMIAADGQTRVMTPPNEPVSTCVAEKLTGIKLPVPPKPDWLIAVNITVKE